MDELKKTVQTEMNEMGDCDVVCEDFSEGRYGFHYDAVAKITDKRYRIYEGYKDKETGNVRTRNVTVNEKMLKAMSLR